jgi:hypothetical protein
MLPSTLQKSGVAGVAAASVATSVADAMRASSLGCAMDAAGMTRPASAGQANLSCPAAGGVASSLISRFSKMAFCSSRARQVNTAARLRNDMRDQGGRVEGDRLRLGSSSCGGLAAIRRRHCTMATQGMVV